MDRDSGGGVIEIVLVERGDIPKILEIENASYTVPFSEDLFEMEILLDIAHFYAAKKGGEIVGYIDFWSAGPEIHLNNIAVDPKHRRQGIGKVLMNFLLDFAKKSNAEEIYLDVRVSNAPAITLYRQFGFASVGIRKGYYIDNQEDALVMGLKVKKATPSTV